MNEIVSKMTLYEKARMCAGGNCWGTYPVERLNIPSAVMVDGPHGVRKENPEAPNVDGFNQHDSFEATCFPTASSLAQSWNPELIRKVGEALGEEAAALDVQILLGPGMNHKRLPIGGRNFEYFSEDPYLSGVLAENYVNGVQSEGVGVSVKHFFANNSEYRRWIIDTEIDERTLREIYLAAFERVIKNAKPKTVMSAYNKFRGEFCSENRRNLTDILRTEWGFKGVVMSDWGAVHDRVKALKAGCNLEMPYQNELTTETIIKAVENGELEESVLDQSVSDLLDTVFELCGNRKNVPLDLDKGYAVALEAAEESIVLLKNEGGILPLKGDFCIIGEIAEKPRFQGAGSSKVKVKYYSTAVNEFNKRGETEYARGYTASGEENKAELIEEAIKIVNRHSVAVVFMGLDDKTETEGADRENIDLPARQLELLQAVIKTGKPVVVVLQTGAPVAMPLINDVSAVVQAGLNGEAGAEALAAVLIGEVSPSGKLTETYPVALSDAPGMKDYASNEEVTVVEEGLLTGYRYYDTKNVKTLFPFGHGLSYTEFEYSDFEYKDGTATVKVKNTGDFDAKTSLQLYVGKESDKIFRVKKELKAFDKHMVRRGESVTFRFELDERAFCHYDVEKHSFVAEGGSYRLYLNESAEKNIFVTDIEI